LVSKFTPGETIRLASWASTQIKPEFALLQNLNLVMPSNRCPVELTIPCA